MISTAGPPQPHAEPARRGGFTIVEFLIVITIITLTASLSIWAYFARPEVTLHNAAELLVHDMRIAQARAALLHSPVSVVFDENGDGYKVVDGVDERPDQPYWMDRIERRYSRDAVFEGVSILPLGLAARGKIVFEGGLAELPSGRVTLSYGDSTRIVELEGGTGKVLLTDL
jgi:type II secretory pathway pseudopilin PulG